MKSIELLQAAATLTKQAAQVASAAPKPWWQRAAKGMAGVGKAVGNAIGKPFEAMGEASVTPASPVAPAAAPAVSAAKPATTGYKSNFQQAADILNSSSL